MTNIRHCCGHQGKAYLKFKVTSESNCKCFDFYQKVGPRLKGILVLSQNNIQKKTISSVIPLQIKFYSCILLFWIHFDYEAGCKIITGRKCYVFIWKSILIMSTRVGDRYTRGGDRSSPWRGPVPLLEDW